MDENIYVACLSKQSIDYFALASLLEQVVAPTYMHYVSVATVHVSYN